MPHSSRISWHWSDPSYGYMHCLHCRLQILILDGPPIIMTINFVATGASLSRQMLEDHARISVPTLARMSSVRWCGAWPRGRGCLGWVLWPKLSLRSLNSRLSSSQLSPLLSYSAITYPDYNNAIQLAPILVTPPSIYIRMIIELDWL